MHQRAKKAQGNPEASRLFEHLLARYNKLARPVRTPNEAIEIQFKLKLLQLLDVHEKDQVLTINGWLIHFSAHGSPAVSIITKVDVHSTGQVTWEPPVIYNSVCKMNIEWFPYDEQHCDMKFGSWTFGGTELDLHHVKYFMLKSFEKFSEFLESDDVQLTVVDNDTEWRVQMGVDISEYQESVEWDLMSAEGTRHKKWYPCCDYPFVSESIDITYYLTIRRKKLFYTINLMTPCIGIAVLASFVFYLPSQIEIVPPTSIHAPLIGKYLMFTMVMVTLSVIVTVFVQNVHYRSEYDPMPCWMRRLFITFLGKYVLIYRTVDRGIIHRKAAYSRARNALQSLIENTSKEMKKICSNVEQRQNSISFQQQRTSLRQEEEILLKSMDLILRAQINVQYIARTLAENSKNEEKRADWRFMAQVIDRILLIGFSCTISLGTAVAMLSAPSIRDRRLPLTATSS
uniref:Neur_chan_LBD domain-containing protein n=2 Tax=Ascaris TaxID=6251 RepID=A0A0M3HQM7_ASCLU